MVLSVPSNTYAALQAAPKKGIVTRDFVWIKAKNRSTGAVETIGLWTGSVAVSVDVIRPSDGATVTRVYQPAAGSMRVPAIPSTMDLEIRSISILFSNLTPAIINAVRVYQSKGQPIEIHRGLFDPATMNIVDPAHCRFDGIVNRAPIKRGKANAEGRIEMQCSGHARTLTRTNAAKFSDEFFKRRGDNSGRYLDSNPKIVWGEEVVVHEKKKKPRERFYG